MNERRDALVQQHLQLARWAAWKRMRRLGPGHPLADFDQLLSAAMLGLLSAAERWDPERGAFSTYALPRIYGAMADQMRAETPGSRTGPSPVLVRLEKVQGMLCSRTDHVRRLETESEAAVVWRAAERCLTPAQLVALRGKYHRGLRGVDMAREQGVTESAISQLLRLALQRLRAELGVPTC